jgi:hypothetical protein
MHFKETDFPDPESPINTKDFPSGTVKEQFCKTIRSPKDLQTLISEREKFEAEKERILSIGFLFVY